MLKIPNADSSHMLAERFKQDQIVNSHEERGIPIKVNKNHK